MVSAAILRKHWLFAIECDHEAKTDAAVCACGHWTSHAQPSVGEAVERWIEHVSILEKLAKAKGGAA